MSMTPTEARAVQTVLAWLTASPLTRPTNLALTRAAAQLATAAHNTLGAGPKGREVERALGVALSGRR